MCRRKKTPTFFRSLSPKDPHFYQLSPNDPLFLTNSLSPIDPDTSLSLKDPLFSHLIKVTIFGKKRRNFQKFQQIWRNVEKFLAILALKAPIFDAFHWKTPYFLGFVIERSPFWCKLSPKDPYIWGSWWHSYVTFICECPAHDPWSVLDLFQLEHPLVWRMGLLLTIRSQLLHTLGIQWTLGRTIEQSKWSMVYGWLVSLDTGEILICSHHHINTNTRWSYWLLVGERITSTNRRFWRQFVISWTEKKETVSIMVLTHVSKVMDIIFEGANILRNTIWPLSIMRNCYQSFVYITFTTLVVFQAIHIYHCNSYYKNE